MADIIGDDLVQCKEINIRRSDGKIVRRTELVPKTVREFGFPWWVVSLSPISDAMLEDLSATRRSVNASSIILPGPSTSPTPRFGGRRAKARRRVGDGRPSGQDRWRRVSCEVEDGDGRGV